MMLVWIHAGIESRDSSCMESRDHGDVERRRQNEGQAQSSVERQLATRSAVVRKPKRQLRQLRSATIAASSAAELC